MYCIICNYSIWMSSFIHLRFYGFFIDESAGLPKKTPWETSHPSQVLMWLIGWRDHAKCKNKDASCYLPGLAPMTLDVTCFVEGVIIVMGKKKTQSQHFGDLLEISIWFLLPTLASIHFRCCKGIPQVARRRGGVVCGVFFCFYASLRLKPSEESAKSSPLLIHHFAQQWIGIASRWSRWSRVLKNAKFLLFSLFVRPYPCKKSIHDGSTHFFFTCFGQRLIQERWFRSEHREDVWHGQWWYSFGQVTSVHLTRSSQTTQCAVVALNGPGKEKTHKKIQIFAITHIQIYHNQSTYQHFLDLPHQHF